MCGKGKICQGLRFPAFGGQPTTRLYQSADAGSAPGFFLATPAPTLRLRSSKRLSNRTRLQQPRCLYERGCTSRPRRAALFPGRARRPNFHARPLPAMDNTFHPGWRGSATRWVIAWRYHASRARCLRRRGHGLSSFNGRRLRVCQCHAMKPAFSAPLRRRGALLATC